MKGMSEVLVSPRVPHCSEQDRERGVSSVYEPYTVSLGKAEFATLSSKKVVVLLLSKLVMYSCWDSDMYLCIPGT